MESVDTVITKSVFEIECDCCGSSYRILSLDLDKARMLLQRDRDWVSKGERQLCGDCLRDLSFTDADGQVLTIAKGYSYHPMLHLFRTADLGVVLLSIVPGVEERFKRLAQWDGGNG